MSKHIAVIYVPFEIPENANIDASDEADEIVQDIMRHGFDTAHLDDVLDVEDAPKSASPYSYPRFSRTELECGHGQDFECIFTVRKDGENQYCIESVDVCMVDLDSSSDPTPIGGVGGELILDCPQNSDGSNNIEQLCRDWLGKWHRNFVGKTEDSVYGMYLIIKQIVAEGNFHG